MQLLIWSDCNVIVCDKGIAIYPERVTRQLQENYNGCLIHILLAVFISSWHNDELFNWQNSRDSEIIEHSSLHLSADILNVCYYSYYFHVLV